MIRTLASYVVLVFVYKLLGLAVVGYLGLFYSLVINFFIYCCAYSVPFLLVYLVCLVFVCDNFDNFNPGLPVLACYVFVITSFDLNLIIEAEI